MIALLLLSFLTSCVVIRQWLTGLRGALAWTAAIAMTSVGLSGLYFGSVATGVGLFFPLLAVVGVNGLLLFKARERIGNLKPSLGRSEGFLMFLVLLVAYFYAEYTARWGGFDAFTMWAAKAKALFFHDHWQELLRETAHADYPLMLPAITAMIWDAIGGIHWLVPLALGIFPVIGVLALLLYGASDRKLGLLIAVLVSMHEGFIHLAAMQYADVLLAFFFLLTIVLVANYLKDETRGDTQLLLIGLVAASGMWVKNEGIVFFLLVSGLLWLFALRKNMRATVMYVSGAVAVIVLVGIFKVFYATSNDVVSANTMDRMRDVLDLSRYILIVTWVKNTLIYQFPMLLIGIVATLLFGGGMGRMRLPALILGLTFLAYCAVYVISPLDLNSHLKTSIDRLFCQLYPAALFILAEIWSASSKKPV